jgi:hypothetical protein
MLSAALCLARPLGGCQPLRTALTTRSAAAAYINKRTACLGDIPGQISLCKDLHYLCDCTTVTVVVKTPICFPEALG